MMDEGRALYDRMMAAEEEARVRARDRIQRDGLSAEEARREYEDALDRILAEARSTLRWFEFLAQGIEVTVDDPDDTSFLVDPPPT